MKTKALDELGVAIANAGYDWTPEMRSAYEKGIRESKWVGLTVEEVLNLLPSSEWKADVTLMFVKAIESKLKEKNA